MENNVTSPPGEQALTCLGKMAFNLAKRRCLIATDVIIGFEPVPVA